jgi:hypothetical protein
LALRVGSRWGGMDVSQDIFHTFQELVPDTLEHWHFSKLNTKVLLPCFFKSKSVASRVSAALK